MRWNRAAYVVNDDIADVKPEYLAARALAGVSRNQVLV